MLKKTHRVLSRCHLPLKVRDLQELLLKRWIGNTNQRVRTIIYPPVMQNQPPSHLLSNQQIRSVLQLRWQPNSKLRPIKPCLSLFAPPHLQTPTSALPGMPCPLHHLSQNPKVDLAGQRALLTNTRPPKNQVVTTRSHNIMTTFIYKKPSKILPNNKHL